MSNRQPDMAGVTFEPVQEPPARIPGAWLLILGFLYPILVIFLELSTRMSATSFFDPMPTWGHVLAVCSVPMVNLLIWSHLQETKPRNARWLVFAAGGAIAIGGFYVLLFLPVVPLAIVGLIVVIGVLPLAPFAAFTCTINLLAVLCRRYKEQSLAKPLVGGIAAGIALILLLDAPGAATRLGIQWAMSDAPSQRERGLSLLRTFGDDDLLLRLCYGLSGQPSGLLSALFAFDNTFDLRPRRTVTLPSADAREIYYRLHGVPFNTKPAPFDKNNAARFADFQFDNDHGGTAVGGRLKGLDMVASRLDGSVNGDDAVAYLEWTVEFRNTSAMDREARLQFALPPGGVGVARDALGQWRGARSGLWRTRRGSRRLSEGRGAAAPRSAAGHHQGRRPCAGPGVSGSPQRRHDQVQARHHGAAGYLRTGQGAPGLAVDRRPQFLVCLRCQPQRVDREQAAVVGLGIEPHGRTQRIETVPDFRFDQRSRSFECAASDYGRSRSQDQPRRCADRRERACRAIHCAWHAASERRAGAGDRRIGPACRDRHALAKTLDAIPPGIQVGAIVASETLQQVAMASWSDAQSGISRGSSARHRIMAGRTMLPRWSKR